MGSTPEDDWCVDCSDDEKYNPTHLPNGTWEPDPKDIVALYKQLASDSVLQLEWKCPGRRSPSPEKMDDSDATQDPNEDALKSKQDEKETVPTAFDFDEFGTQEGMGPITPRRTPGSKTPKSSQKRVARLDKIMDDILRFKKLDDEAEKTPQRRMRMFKSRQKSPQGSTPINSTGTAIGPKNVPNNRPAEEFVQQFQNQQRSPSSHGFEGQQNFPGQGVFSTPPLPTNTLLNSSSTSRIDENMASMVDKLDYSDSLQQPLQTNRINSSMEMTSSYGESKLSSTPPILSTVTASVTPLPALSTSIATRVTSSPGITPVDNSRVKDLTMQDTKPSHDAYTPSNKPVPETAGSVDMTIPKSQACPDHTTATDLPESSPNCIYSSQASNNANITGQCTTAITSCVQLRENTIPTSAPSIATDNTNPPCTTASSADMKISPAAVSNTSTKQSEQAESENT